MPAGLPRYEIDVRIDPTARRVSARERVVFTNRSGVAVGDLVFHVYPRYKVPESDRAVLARTLEYLRLSPEEAIDARGRRLEVERVRIGGQLVAFGFDPQQDTILIVPLPEAVPPGGSVTAEIDFVLDLPDTWGRWGHHQGITYLIEALVDVKAADGRPATMAMAGGGPEFEQTKARIAELGLTDRIEILGVRPVRQALNRGHCLVVASLAESLPYVILEGSAAGRPVISTNVGGISEIFGPTSGSLFPAADTAALRTAMQKFIDDPAAAMAEARVRLDYIRPRFSISHMVDQIEALYYETLAKRRG